MRLSLWPPISDADPVSSMEWRSMPGHPTYEVSECGDVRRAVRSRTRAADWRLRGFINEDGYVTYALKEGGTRTVVCAHRVVALAFIGPQPSEGHEIAHNNGSRLFNHYSNLRWATRKQNAADMQHHETAQKGEKNGRAKLSTDDVRNIRAEYRQIKNRLSTKKVGDLAAEYGVHHGTLLDIAKGRSWRHIPLEDRMASCR